MTNPAWWVSFQDNPRPGVDGGSTAPQEACQQPEPSPGRCRGARQDTCPEVLMMRSSGPLAINVQTVPISLPEAVPALGKSQSAGQYP